jgi:SAM-dependent methyltransferase
MAYQEITFVLFLPDGRCAALSDPDGGLRLPTGRVAPGEHWLLDTCLRVPLETAGFRMQRAVPFREEGAHLYVWLEGDRYAGRRPHATVELVADTPAAIAARLRDDPDLVRAAAASFANQSDEDFYAASVRLLEPAYLRGATAEQGSGFGGGPAEWRALRGMVLDGIDRDGTFLDVGCANGLLMESVHAWAAERGLAVEPYGVDLAPGLVARARERLPRWADRIVVGNAIDHRPADGRRFTYVHVLLDLVPAGRRADLVRHARAALVEPGGRLLVSRYQPAGGAEPAAAAQLRALGFAVTGESRAASAPGEGPDGIGCPASTAWLD